MMKLMNCAVCRNGTTTDGHTIIVLERDQTTAVFKKVPAQICNNCGEEYVSAEVNESLLSQAHVEWERGITLEMLNFAA